MRVCILYDCLYPWTIGGAERWYRQIAEAHTAAGNEVTYLTLRQWDPGDEPNIPGVRVVAVGPRMALYVRGRRRILPALVFGMGVFWHLLRLGRRFDLVHGASFPFFSLLAAGMARPFGGYRIAIDWHEVWSRKYWRHYLGRMGDIGWCVQWLCAQMPQTAFSFSRLHEGRAEAMGLANVTLLEGEYDGGPVLLLDAAAPACVLFAGRMIPEKRVPLLVDALALLMRDDPHLHAELIGRGPQLDDVRRRIKIHGLEERIVLSGFVDPDYLEERQRQAAVIVQPSEREGYGMIVVEAAARGVPVVLIAGDDNAAVELINEGENGFVAPAATPESLAGAIALALANNLELRQKVRSWYDANRQRLSFEHSFKKIMARLSGVGQ